MNHTDFFLDEETTTVQDFPVDTETNMNMFDWMSEVPLVQQQPTSTVTPLCVTSLNFSNNGMEKSKTSHIRLDMFSIQTAHDFSPSTLLQTSPFVQQQQQQPFFMPPVQQQPTTVVIESPSEDLETSLSADEQKQEAANHKPAMTKSSLMDLVEGFITPPSQKQYGGKDNREILPIHIVRVHSSLLLPLQHLKLKIQVDLHGYKKMSRVKTHLARVAELGFKVTGSDVDVTFDELVIRHSSHNCGQKLLLRFTLMDENNQSYDFVDTSEFETITKRGIEKQRQKQKATKKREAKTYKFKSYDATTKQQQQQMPPQVLYNVPLVPQQQAPLWFQSAPTQQQQVMVPQSFAFSQSQMLANPSILDVLLDTHHFRQAVLQ